MLLGIAMLIIAVLIRLVHLLRSAVMLRNEWKDRSR
jgi:hypothetical protein